ncbi:MAG: PspC domain-containing protein [Flavobacteriaceae bacterium]|jgi:phage shock protein PspC (stress-responsive transcriptional regulator)|nr:PspC domain-containing protein [Flavobacteriaceae bacterium]
MNKTVTVNIGGLVFHIEEQAYLKLDQYLKAIRNSISIEEQDEVIHDIEIRIAELFSEYITTTNQVVTTADVDRVVEIMGKPEDYKLSEDETTDQQNSSNTGNYIYTKQPKLYRDTQNGMIGGVLAGFGHYFKIEAVWLRIIFAVLLLFYGTGILLYIIFWAVVPEAKTASQRLEMQGEPINIDTIEKKVKENIEYVTNKFGEVDYEGIKRQVRSTGNNAGQVLQKFFGIFFIITALFGLLGTGIASVALWINRTNIFADELNYFPVKMQETFTDGVLVMLLSFIMILPFIGLLLIGSKLIYNNIKYILPSIILLFVLWLAAIFAFAIPFVNMKNYDDINLVIKENILNGEDAQQTEDFELDSEYKELKVIVVNPVFFASDRKNITPYVVTDTTALKNIDLEILPTFQNNIYGTFTVKYVLGKEYHNQKITTKNILDINQFYDKEENTLYISEEPNLNDSSQESNSKLNTKCTIYLPIDTKIHLTNIFQSTIDNMPNIKPNTWYQMQKDNTLSEVKK